MNPKSNPMNNAKTHPMSNPKMTSATAEPAFIPLRGVQPALVGHRASTKQQPPCPPAMRKGDQQKLPGGESYLLTGSGNYQLGATQANAPAVFTGTGSAAVSRGLGEESIRALFNSNVAANSTLWRAAA
jgi:hypothetical protein